MTWVRRKSFVFTKTVDQYIEESLKKITTFPQTDFFSFKIPQIYQNIWGYHMVLPQLGDVPA